MFLSYILFYSKKSVILVETTYIATIFPTLLKLFLLFTCLSFQQPFRLDRNKNGRRIFLYVCEDIPAKLVSNDHPTSESFYVEFTLHKKKCLINCFYNPHPSNISIHWILLVSSFIKIRCYSSR